MMPEARLAGDEEMAARKRQVLALLGQDRANRELTAECHVSEKTVTTQASSILASAAL